MARSPLLSSRHEKEQQSLVDWAGAGRGQALLGARALKAKAPETHSGTENAGCPVPVQSKTSLCILAADASVQPLE